MSEDPSLGKLFEPTMQLRWYWPIITHRDTIFKDQEWTTRGEKILQQAYICREDGTIEWRDVPVEEEI